MTDYGVVFMTASNQGEAEKIAENLLSNKLAACVNIIDKMKAMYMWDGRLQDDNETILIAKTTKECMPDLIQKVKSLHSYDCPCIVSLPVSDGNPEFLNWFCNAVQ